METCPGGPKLRKKRGSCGVGAQKYIVNARQVAERRTLRQMNPERNWPITAARATGNTSHGQFAKCSSEPLVCNNSFNSHWKHVMLISLLCPPYKGGKQTIMQLIGGGTALKTKTTWLESPDPQSSLPGNCETRKSQGLGEAVASAQSAWQFSPHCANAAFVTYMVWPTSQATSLSPSILMGNPRQS